MIATMNELINVFNHCSIDGNLIFPPSKDDMEIPAKLYADFKKLLTQNLGKWKAGKTQAFEFPFEPSDLLTKLRAGEKPNYKQEWHYFPTPTAVVEEMLNTCIVEGKFKALEPSAGRGAIIEGINEMAGFMAELEWDAVEAEPINRGILEEKGINVVGEDFDTFETEKRYDIIYANPPFKKDLQHVGKMLKLLDKGGCAVIVLPSNFKDKYQKQISEWEEQFESLGFRDLPKNSFKESKTSIDTILLYAKFKQT
jgi:16S rRNA G966 N2-methylase RsmD